MFIIITAISGLVYSYFDNQKEVRTNVAFQTNEFVEQLLKATNKFNPPLPEAET